MNIERKIKELEFAPHSVLWWSGGAESTLLLLAMRSRSLSFDIVRFDEFLTRQQKRYGDNLITSLNLKVFSYPSKEVYFIGQGKEVSAVFEIPLSDGSTIPLIRDCVKGTRCAMELGTVGKIAVAPVHWESHIVGTRKTDSHYAFEGIRNQVWQVGQSVFSAPLFDWTRREVEEGLRHFGAELPPEPQNTGDLHICTNCLKETATTYCPAEKRRIPTVKWDRDLMTSVFKEKYGFCANN
jgi:hypothetical protein